MKIVSIGPVEGSATSFESALIGGVAKLGVPPKGIVLYLPIAADHGPFLEAAASLGVPVVGATTGGAAFTERGLTRTGAVAALIGGDNLELEYAVARNIKQDPKRALNEALGGFNLRASRSLSMLVLMDAFATDGEELVTALRDNTPLHCRCFGGTAGDDWTFEGTKVFFDREVLSDACVFVAFRSDTRVEMGVLHGWCVAPGSRDLTITSIEGNVLKTLDGLPAAHVYRAELERLGLLSPGEPLVQVLAKYELGANTPFGEHLKVRAPLAIGDDGSITLASSLEPRQIVRVMSASPEQLIDAAHKLAKSVRTQLEDDLSGALVFDCAARLQLLGDAYAEEAAALLGSGTYPVVGMACYGEIAKFGGNLEGFHNTTTVMVGW